MSDTTTRPEQTGPLAFADFTHRWVHGFAATATATETELTALDQQVGDGDFGMNLVAGLQATLRLLSPPTGDAALPTGRAVTPAGPAAGTPPPGRAAPDASPAAPLAAAATAFLDEVGGTSGPLFGLLFQELADAVREGGAGSPTAALAAGVRGGLAAIQRVGDAEVGDKTLVDALDPAARALAAATTDDPAQALGEAAGAAWRGVHDTTRSTARRGRASYLGDRAAGVPDPGAVGIALLFTAAGGPVTSLAPLLH
ncbi:DAK2 domain-containing protein [Actinacidiphila epipremni]|jgi:dihydroxyacetone kinase-like protein|uniref:DAK2 domain-containing protein n=1 Tax=Actinacidiphila epipremni TaxID=2053013 RepID=A0ABX0ZZF1_9ACTN|nr:DAK2 domain-containing protein [Actinacidiphila epipremni]NJP48102.1 DAK2 domain-containing protein [Actinacidiphila epipremni]